jgi:hypothetical protein
MTIEMELSRVRRHACTFFTNYGTRYNTHKNKLRVFSEFLFLSQKMVRLENRWMGF